MKFKYCPNCGLSGSVQLVERSKYVCRNCNWEFWNNPKAAAAVIFVNAKGQLLFARRAHAPDKGKYDFVGGFLDYGEDPLAAAVREVKEETGATVDPDDVTLLAAHTLDYTPGVTVVDLVMITKKWRGPMEPQDDVADLKWAEPAFMHDPGFRPNYPGLEEKIRAYLSS